MAVLDLKLRREPAAGRVPGLRQVRAKHSAVLQHKLSTADFHLIQAKSLEEGAAIGVRATDRDPASDRDLTRTLGVAAAHSRFALAPLTTAPDLEVCLGLRSTRAGGRWLGVPLWRQQLEVGR